MFHFKVYHKHKIHPRTLQYIGWCACTYAFIIPHRINIDTLTWTAGLLLYFILSLLNWRKMCLTSLMAPVGHSHLDPLKPSLQTQLGSAASPLHSQWPCDWPVALMLQSPSSLTSLGQAVLLHWQYFPPNSCNEKVIVWWQGSYFNYYAFKIIFFTSVTYVYVSIARIASAYSTTVASPPEILLYAVTGYRASVIKWLNYNQCQLFAHLSLQTKCVLGSMHSFLSIELLSLMEQLQKGPPHFGSHSQIPHCKNPFPEQTVEFDIFVSYR